MTTHDWIRAGHAAKAAEHAAEENTKLGQFRGGTSGAVGSDGTVYGKCERLALLRSLGLQDDVDDNTREKFEAGYANEAVVVDLLTRGLAVVAPELELVTGKPIEFSYTLKDGTIVSCRPDAAVRRRDTGALVLGYEFKLAMSMWTAMAVHYDLRPRSDHLIQAAHYSAKLGNIPFVLLYSSRSEFHLSTAPKWLQSKFGPGVYDIEYKREDSSKPMKILPFNRTYDLSWGADGRLFYMTEGLAQPTPTAITAAGIEQYYEGLAKARDGATLPPRPGTTAVDGSDTWNQCSFCDLKDTCDTHEDNKLVWLDQVRLQLAKGK